MAEAFALLMPVKFLSAAKSRLELDVAASRSLMAAFTLDAVAAARRSPLVAEVHLVSEEQELADAAGVALLHDEGGGDLNRALAVAATRVQRQHPGLGIAAMCADLPCLVEADLTTALGAGDSARWCVTDAAGTGTTLLVARPGIELAPLFGPGSAQRHVASGATPVAADVPTLRRDVDTPADLARAAALGVGLHTAAAMASLRVA